MDGLPFDLYIHMPNLSEHFGKVYRKWQQNERILGSVSRGVVRLLKKIATRGILLITLDW